jgi:hypothetical protein
MQQDFECLGSERLRTTFVRLCVMLCFTTALHAADAPLPSGRDEFVAPGPAEVTVQTSARPNATVPEKNEQNAAVKKEADAGASGVPGQVRLVAIKTDVAKRYKTIVPPLPVPPFTSWRKWLKEHEESVHCALEWCDDKGVWWHGELRSTNFDTNMKRYRVGWGEFPGTGYDAYGIYIMAGRIPRDVDERGRPLVVTLDEEIAVSHRALVRELMDYAAKYRRSGEPGTGGAGERNVGLGGPAYKPSQNSNTMVNYVLRRCGLKLAAPEQAVGWDTIPQFPYSTNADAIPRDAP